MGSVKTTTRPRVPAQADSELSAQVVPRRAAKPRGAVHSDASSSHRRPASRTRNACSGTHSRFGRRHQHLPANRSVRCRRPQPRLQQAEGVATASAAGSMLQTRIARQQAGNDTGPTELSRRLPANRHPSPQPGDIGSPSKKRAHRNRGMYSSCLRSRPASRHGQQDSGRRWRPGEPSSAAPRTSDDRVASARTISTSRLALTVRAGGGSRFPASRDPSTTSVAACPSSEGSVTLFQRVDAPAWRPMIAKQVGGFPAPWQHPVPANRGGASTQTSRP
jgi:hypothetical protein